MKFGGIDTLFLQKRIASNDLSHLISGPRNDVGGKTEIAQNPRLDLLRQGCWRNLLRLKYQVPALNKSLDLLQSQSLARGPQLFHLHPLVRANINSAQHRNIDGRDETPALSGLAVRS